MDRSEQLIADFAARGGTLAPDLFDVARALEIVERCRDLELDLLGIEGFESCAVGIMPRLDWIYDASADPRAYDAARTFLESYGAAHLHFAFTLADPPPLDEQLSEELEEPVLSQAA
jgi:hypothetical protein